MVAWREFVFLKREVAEKGVEGEQRDGGRQQEKAQAVPHLGVVRPGGGRARGGQDRLSDAARHLCGVPF